MTSVVRRTAAALVRGAAAALLLSCSDPLPTPSHLVFIIQPSNTTVGQPMSTVTVAVMFDQGDVAMSSTALIEVELVGGNAGATLGGTTSVHAVNGVATFTGLTINQAFASYALSASSPGLTHATSASFAVTP